MISAGSFRGFRSLQQPLLARIDQDRHLDRLEVFYLSELDLVVPIISKNACSSLKESLLRFYKSDFSADFPEIHRVNAELLTSGKVQRLFFRRATEYQRFVEGKIVRIVVREPMGRLVSGYKDHVTRKNIMYAFNKFEQRIRRMESTEVSFASFAASVCSTPVNLADRHFKAQSIFVPNTAVEEVRYLRLSALEQDWRADPLFSQIPFAEVRNKGDEAAVEKVNISEARRAHAKAFESDYVLWERVNSE